MGSKKARKKKIKCEKESKMCKLRKLREKRVACSQFCEESYSDESFQCNEIYQNRLHTNNNSRFYTGEKGISKLSNFIEVYF